jgi:hypothetical protein
LKTKGKEGNHGRELASVPDNRTDAKVASGKQHGETGRSCRNGGSVPLVPTCLDEVLGDLSGISPGVIPFIMGGEKLVALFYTRNCHRSYFSCFFVKIT